MTSLPRPGAGTDRQVPVRLRLAFGVGSVADGVKNAAFNAFLVLYYTTVLGLPGTLSRVDLSPNLGSELIKYCV